jgi:hypothetical protein
MALRRDFIQAASLHGLQHRFPPSCNNSWPQAKISFKLQVFMASSLDFLQAATINGLKPKFYPSCKSSWPKAKISSKL